MSKDLHLIVSLRRVLESVAMGGGVAESLVRELSRADPPADRVAKNVLLGFHFSSSIKPLLTGGGKEVGMLASLIAESASSSAVLLGKSGGALSYILERWAKARENRKLELRVMRFRGLLASGVLGAVSAMIASLAPVLFSISIFSSDVPQETGSLLPAAGAMSVISSAMLGYYIGGGKPIANIAVSATSFALVAVLVAPLASFSYVNLGGIK